MIEVTRKLAELVANTKYSDLPQDVIDEAKRRIADVIGAGLSGSITPMGQQIGKYSVMKGGQGKGTIWGSGQKTKSQFASLANGTATFHLELDDVHRTSHTHPGVCVVPAAVALGEELGSSGKDLILATVLGYEVAIRVGMGVSPSIYVDRVFLAPGTLGVLGAAAAAAKLHKLDVEATAGVIGAVSYLGPIAPFESFKKGAGVKETIMGWANYLGIEAIDLVKYGFGGPAAAIEGDFGYCKAVSERYSLERIVDKLGEVYEIMNTGIKPYACCRQHHAAIDAVWDIQKEHNPNLDEIESIRVRTFVVSSRGNDKNPQSIGGAKYSIPFILAVALTYGKVWREQFTLDLIADPKLKKLASKVEVEPDMELDALYDEKWPSIVEMTMKNGQVLTARRDLPKGEPEYPVSDNELKEKFLSLAGDTVSEDRAKKIWDTIFNLESVGNVAELTALLTGNR